MSQDGTTSEDYGRCYYNEAHLGGYDDYTWDNEKWRSFFMSVADRLVGALNPRTVLDVGCARGLLVQAFAVQGIDSRGVDISAHAIESAHPDVRDRLSVASATEPIKGRYDLVTCVEVLEHMSPQEAQLAIDHMTAVTDRILFSSSPGDHDEPTHINTRPTEQWVAWFSERGFFRRTDLDMGMIAPWSVLLERGEPTIHELTQRYEQQYARERTELTDKRAALLDAHRRIQELHEQLDERPVDTEEVDRLTADVAQARHAVLVNRDHVIGLEAENGRLNRDLTRVTMELRQLRRRTKSLAQQRDELRQRVQDLRTRLDRNRARVAELESTGTGRPSIARRAARRVRSALR
ncbi:methyltransferase domain-containing protein [Nocardioides cavernae]|uniref:Methyltransferase domain-containing protein n=1 Tax=Nocardioides cavernae TaxID=1921566 RepID=A0ABR8NH96_9ACTN|nr:class I SAM-dependent methyltransferase [Nocardioides cavernae]MBD3926646.1 methyltransferase domain-containing protein [Nocardioides cavernae]MBM7512368.1 SAM-dependent methyltransferase [Nocardioides cavernae]